MKRRKLFWKVLKVLQVDKILLGYIGIFFLIALGIWRLEPTITTYGDGLWYCFGVATTIGFGDLLATTLVCRILTIILSFFSTLMLALVPTIMINYFMQYTETRKNEGALVVLNQLQNLENLSHEELAELSKKIKRITKK